MAKTTTISSGVTSTGLVTSGAIVMVDAGGQALDTAVTRTGRLEIYGSASDTTLADGGIDYVSSGGAATSTTVNSSTSEYVYSGGTATSTTVNDGGTEIVYSGGSTIDDTLNNGGYESIVGTATGTTVSSGGAEYIFSGGTAVDTVLNGGDQLLYTGATASNTVVNSGGTLLLSGSGANTVSVTLGAGGSEIVSSGTEAFGTVVSSGGVELVYSGGAASGTVVSSGGILVVLQGASVSGTTSLTGADVVSTGIVVVQPSGVTIYTSTASGVTFGMAMAESVPSGGTTVDTTVSGVTLSAGMTEYVLSGGTAIDTTVNSGGAEYVNAGGTDSGTTVNSGGAEYIYSGGTASSTTVDTYGNQYVSSGGIASNTNVSSDGSEYVSKGGTAISTTVSGGFSYVLSGGTIIDTKVETGGFDELNSGATAIDTTVNNGGEGVDSGGTASDTTVENDGYQYVYSGGTASGTTVTANGQEVVFSGGTAIDTTVNNGGIEGLYAGATVSGLTLKDGAQIELDVAYVSGATVSLNALTDELTITNNGISYSAGLAGTYTGDTFAIESYAGDSTLITIEAAPCYLRGTRILTPSGERQVEDLRIADDVITLSGEARPIRWIGYRHLDLFRHKTPEQVQPILIRAGAFADGLPRRDLRVSPDHAVLLDAVLVPAKLLINGASIERDTQCGDVTYYHVELATHDILLAEALPAESYIDTGNRGTFENADAPLILHPAFDDGQARRVAASCRPFVDDAASVQPFWSRLAARAVALGLNLPAPIETTRDPGLHIVTGGRTIQPVGVIRGRYTFVLPETGDPIHLISRATRPCDARPWVEDRRRLGVMISRLTLRRDADVETIQLDHPLLTSGWWDAESDRTKSWRWTNGDATIPTCLNRQEGLEIASNQQIPIAPGGPAERKIATGLQSPIILELIVAGGLDYPVESDLQTRHDRNLDPAATQSAAA